jgi:hypothetical protein
MSFGHEVVSERNVPSPGNHDCCVDYYSGRQVMRRNHDEDRRHSFEVRYWLKATDGKKNRVDAALARIAQRRGQEAADRLRKDMREEYARQRKAKD